MSLVTGRLLNGSQRNSRLEPEPLEPGEIYDLEIDLHFTTWTFKPGHRVRLAVFQLAFCDDLAHPAPDDHSAAPGRGEHTHGAARDPAREAQGAGVPAT